MSARFTWNTVVNEKIGLFFAVAFAAALFGALPMEGQAANFDYSVVDDQTLFYFNLSPSTAALDAITPVVILSTNTARVGSLVCNECSADIRIGNASITTAIGLLIKAERCVTLDIPRYFRGVLWAISTSGSCKVSAVSALP